MNTAELSTIADPEARLNHLRRWALSETGFGHPVRTETGRVALSALLRRLSIFGLESSVDSLTASDLCQAVALTAGQFSTHLARIALSRAFVENNQRVIHSYAAYGVESEMLTWFVEREQATAERAQELITSQYIEREELYVTRLIIARRYPQFVTSAWLSEPPASLAVVVHHLARIAATRPELTLALVDFLSARRDVLLADDPDAILAQLVTHSGTSPQTLLVPFSGLYGDPTVLAAARWHLEHGQPRPAFELAQRIRPLSRLSEASLLISGLAAIELGDHNAARAIRRLSDDHQVQDQLDLRLALLDSSITTSDIGDIAKRCQADQPERLATCLRLLLARKDLPGARSVVASQSARFTEHPILGQMFAAIGRG